MAKFSNFKDSKTKQEEQQTPQYVTLHCCAPGCGFTETVNASDPRPFTCKYHQQADRRFWPNITKNIREFIPFYQMGLEFTINRKFDRFVDTEPELLTQWANKNGVPQLAPRKVRTKRGVEYERCYDFGARVLKFFDNHVVSDFMIEDKKLSMQEAEEKRKKEKSTRLLVLSRLLTFPDRLRRECSSLLRNFGRFKPGEKTCLKSCFPFWRCWPA